ncbi:MAG: hypothetical protein RL216_2562 [Pseudomonadota bacterium]
MLLRLLVLLALIGALPAHAQTLRVGSGEHGSFTRLVMPIPPGGDWQLQRSPRGYVLTLSGTDQRFDLSRAYARIDRDRISDLQSGTAGELSIMVACACHAIPFEFRSDMLVIDIRDGAPPAGSTFERAPSGERLPPLRDVAENLPAPRPNPRFGLPEALDWTAEWLNQRNEKSGPTARAEPLPALSLDSEDLRATLLLELSRAAADGMIEPAEKLPPPADDNGRSTSVPENMRVGDPLATRSGLRDETSLTELGETCPPDDSLAIETWGDGRPAPIQLAESSASILGEFDIADPEAVRKSVRMHLHLGFGAEALQLLTLHPLGGADDPLLRSVARMIDGLTDPSGPFPDLAACDNPAALWAALSDPPRLPAALNRAAALRAFSALPPHLRRHLGPTLAEAFLAADDIPSATTVADAILRLPGPPDDRTAILSARLALLSGGRTLAEDRLQTILSDPGPDQAAALVALIDLHAAEARPIAPDILPSLAAYRTESAGTFSEPTLQRAVILASALSGDFSSAFAEAASMPSVLPDLWRLLGSAADEALLLHAIGASPDDARPESRTIISGRLAALGFPEEARRWSGIAGPLPLTALPPDPLRSALRARDWQRLPDDAPEVWQSAVAALPDGTGEDLPPLTRARTLAEQSASTRAALDSLLRNVASP